MKILRYGDPTTTLRGQIYTDYFFGRPGFGETPEVDEPEHAVLLAIDEPFSVPGRNPEYEGDFESVGRSDVYDQHANLIGVVTSKLRTIGDVVPENVSFVIRTQRLLEMCGGLKDKQENEESRILYPPVVLGKLMQQLCVEIECWEQGAADH